MCIEFEIGTERKEGSLRLTDKELPVSMTFMDRINSDVNLSDGGNMLPGVTPKTPSAEAVNSFTQAMTPVAQSSDSTDSSELDAKKLFDQNMISMCIQQATESIKRSTEEMRKNLEKNS